ncbi:type II toxin-antitoxin system PemK/MazF family toxin [Nesterenkonia ebinurensis]|uniref:type II toxin-antitoxin system PemK/MazF family toxin n=1 Tax=Nesterenkonia ebinurensis TaxID=2608252 RepID=UPI00123E3CA4|nr:type II toxin-antitoxin system PemK/MazF family toxin [Nesterenkonia ebinurensis]
MREARRGDVWTIGGGPGGDSNKPRPAIIIRSDSFENPESITMIPLTTVPLESPTRVHIGSDEATGIANDSYAMTDKIHTYKRSALGTYCGRLTAEQLVEVERALLLYLGIAG